MTNRLPFRFLMNIKVSIHYERLQVKINTTNLDTTNHNTIGRLRASLDTNAVIHFYRAGLYHILFDLLTMEFA